MGINFEEVKAIIQLGIMGVISYTYITQQKRLFEQQEKVITVLAKLENQLNNDFLKGKGLEIALILKIQDMRWAVQKRILKYIKNNHLEENWDVINKEIKTFFDAKMINFENDMHDIIEETTYKLLSKMIKDEFEQTKEILLHILDDLKREGVEEKDLYGKAARIVETHMESIENELVAKIKSVIKPDEINVTHDISLIATVGENMKNSKGLSGRLFKALGEAGVNIALISQTNDEINIIVGVHNSDYEKTINTIYQEFK